MPTQWSTFPIEFKGGLISNMSPLQQGINAIGSATILQNMESDRQGGYTKIRGYEKFADDTVPGTDKILGLKVVSSGRVVAARKLDAAAITAQQATASVNGATSSSTAVVLDGNTGTIAQGMVVTGTGISGTVTVSTVTDQNNIVLSSAQTLADDTVLTFQKVGLQTADVSKTAYYFSTGSNSGWTHMVTSPSTGGGKIRHVSFNFDGDDKTVFVDGTNYPVVYNSSGNTMAYLDASTTGISTDLQGASLVTFFDKSIVYAKDNFFYISSPNTVGNVVGSVGPNFVSNAGNTVTGLTVFREKLIVFTSDKIQAVERIVDTIGTATVFFQITPITDKQGCISADSLQEFGGDIMYLAPDGLRLLSATDRIGDFALDVTSDKIFKDADDFLRSTTEYCSVIIREKAQYRIFAYVGSQTQAVSEGLIATKFIAQGADGVEWATTKGIKAFVADSIYSGTSEAIMFGNEDGYIYEMEQSNGFDGSSIETVIETPYMSITDPEVRKTAYKLTLYTDPTGQMDLKFRLLFDFDSGGDSRIVQPDEIDIGSETGGDGVFIYGQPNAVYGGSSVVYGTKLKKVYNENLIGSFHTVAMRITSDSTNPPFTLDSAVLQYRQNDRQ